MWLVDRGLFPKQPKWSVEITLPTTVPDARMRIEIFAEEWGYVFEHGGRQSWIRVTDLRFAHVRDDHALLEETSSLRTLGELVRKLEARFALHFDRDGAEIRSTIADSDDVIRDWIASL